MNLPVVELAEPEFHAIAVLSRLKYPVSALDDIIGDRSQGNQFLTPTSSNQVDFRYETAFWRVAFFSGDIPRGITSIHFLKNRGTMTFHISSSITNQATLSRSEHSSW